MNIYIFGETTDSVLQKLLGWLLLAVGGSHVTDSFPRLHNGKQVIREDNVFDHKSTQNRTKITICTNS